MKYTHHKQQGSTEVIVIAILVVALVVALGWMFYQNFIVKKPVETRNDAPVVSKDDDAPVKVPVKDAIKAAVESKQYGDLQPYMNDSVGIIYAATEHFASTTPAGAVKEMGYIKKAQGPWNFGPDAVDIERARQSEYYGRYFPQGAVVGKSADNYVASFILKDGKIDRIFLSTSDDVLYW